jgi:hypothetical protein
LKAATWLDNAGYPAFYRLKECRHLGKFLVGGWEWAISSGPIEPQERGNGIVLPILVVSIYKKNRFARRIDLPTDMMDLTARRRLSAAVAFPLMPLAPEKE